MRAAPPADQVERLKDLRDLDILDTAPESRFDDVVNLASAICGMPISLISLVAEDRQWFKAVTGLVGRETPVEQAICAHAILADDYLEIADTRADPRTRDNPLVTGPENLRFYAGAVLRTRRGHAVGTLCVLDNQPNRLTDLQRETLRVLARQVMAQMELRGALAEADILRREVDHRVKNSLQSLSALTRMQARSATSDETRAALALTQHRIETVALLHQQLYASRDGADIAMADFLPGVARLLAAAIPEQIAITADVAPLTLPAPRAAAVAVIVNECTANAVKHAYDADAAGTIRLSLQPDGGGHAVLVCADDGRGMPAPADPDQGLGLRIITASAQQLGGRAAFDTGTDGTRVTVRFRARYDV